MEVESMNFDGNEADEVRKLVQSSKREFDRVRREMRNAQSSYDAKNSSRSTDIEMGDKTTNQLMRQR